MQHAAYKLYTEKSSSPWTLRRGEERFQSRQRYPERLCVTEHTSAVRAGYVCGRTDDFAQHF